MPVDSEHSALFQLSRRAARDGREAGPHGIRRPVPRAHRPLGVTREEALAHPTWDMGGRITIDSATLINKGLEMIEAHHLFGFHYEPDRRRRPPAVADPLARPPQRRRHARPSRAARHAGADLLRAPLPRRVESRAQLDLAEVGELSFEPPDPEAFPCLRLAREAGEAGGTAPCVLNAADEVAVEAFLDGRIPFTAIAEVVEETLDSIGRPRSAHFDDLFGATPRARGPGHLERRSARTRPMPLVSWSSPSAASPC